MYRSGSHPCSRLVACAFILLATSVPAQSHTAARTVKTSGGTVLGVPADDPHVTAFLGIPYAAPPVGDLRWREPQPAAKWTGVRKADHLSPSCMQHINSGDQLPWEIPFLARNPISEDCLYLNVWTPDVTTKAPKAVVVWIHGGGFTVGSSAADIVNGAAFAQQGVVFVSINYRLGLMGFNASPALAAESAHHTSGNYGLMDMIAALQWTKQNIRAFGGDPDKITIAGQSAGADAVIYLTASPLAKGLFRGGIIESGAYLNDPSANDNVKQQQMGTQLETFTKKSLKELRELSATDIVMAGSKAHLKFTPSIDGWVLPQTVSATFADGKQNDVPTINGMVADEGSSHAGYGKLTPEEFQKKVRDTRGSFAEDFLKLYPSSTQAEATTSQIEFERDRRLVSMYLWGEMRARTAHTPAYTYIFTHAIPWPEHPEFAVFHCTEMPYWMLNLKRLNNPSIKHPYMEKDFQISDTVSAYWMNFIKTGSPNGRSIPAWPAFDAVKMQTMNLGDVMAARSLVSPERLALWLRFMRAHAPKSAD